MLLGIGAEAQQLSHATVQIAERVGIKKLLLEAQLISFSVPTRTTAEVAHAVQCQNRGFVKGRREKCGSCMRVVVFHQHQAAGGEARAQSQMQGALLSSW